MMSTVLAANPATPAAKSPPPSEEPPPREIARTVEDVVGATPASPWLRWLRIVAAVVLVVGLAVASLRLYQHLQRKPAAYATTPVRRGDLSVVVSATGNLAPVNQIDVGSELSGTVERLYVDENDRVRKGQVLAELDTSRLRDQIVLGQAAITTARAQLAQAEATITEMRLQAGRKHKLFESSGGGWPAKADIDAADAALARAVATAAAGRAAIEQAQATLNTNRTNLAKAEIRSPVDGVVLTRNVDVGQTVAAALQAPVLFTIAEDMRRMELDADIDEADVGQVREGQSAVFTVDAYPGREYPAVVTRVGYGSQTKEGVVTYKGVLAVDNADLTLRPGMTASADIRVTRRANVLIVPDAALRFTPQTTAQSPGASSALLPRMPRFGAGPQLRSADNRIQQVWVLKNGKPQPVAVRAGASDGRDTEVSGEALRVGLPVITERVEAHR